TCGNGDPSNPSSAPHSNACLSLAGTCSLPFPFLLYSYVFYLATSAHFTCHPAPEWLSHLLSSVSLSPNHFLALDQPPTTHFTAVRARSEHVPTKYFSTLSTKKGCCYASLATSVLHPEDANR